MPLATLTSEMLQVWREAERLQDSLAPTAPDHETAARLVATLRETYGRLQSTSSVTSEQIEWSRRTVMEAREILRAITAGGTWTIDHAHPSGGSNPR